MGAMVRMRETGGMGAADRMRPMDRLLLILTAYLILIVPVFQGRDGTLARLTQLTDEAVTVLAVLILAGMLVGGAFISRLELAITVIFVVFLLWGGYCTLAAQIQPWRYVLEDILSCCKFIAPFLAIRMLRGYLREERVLAVLQGLAVWSVRLLFGLAVLDLALPGRLFPQGEVRFLVHSVQLFYYHPVMLVQVGMLLLSILSVPAGRKVTREIWMVCALIFLTFRMRAVGFLFLYACMRIIPVYVGRKGRYLAGGAGLLGAAAIGYESFAEYYLNTGQTARSLLTVNGNLVAMHYLPFGSGYATYGSAAAAKYYSPIYQALGYPRRYGLSPRNPQYLTDTFWPAVTAQFGFPGLLLFLVILLLIGWEILDLYKVQSAYTAAAVTLFGYLLISTVGSSSFFNPMAVAYGILFGLILSAGYKRGSAGEDKDGAR